MAQPKPVSITAKKVRAVSLEERLSKFRRERDTSGVSWREVSAISLRKALHCALAEGAALMFSPASGGLGVCLTVFQDGDRQKIYESTAEDLSTALDGIADAFAGGSEDIHQAMLGGVE